MSNNAKRASKEWTEADVEIARKIIKEGGTYEDVAVHFSMTINAASSRCRARDIYSLHKPWGFEKTSFANLQPPRLISPVPEDEPEPLGPLRNIPPDSACRFIRADISSGEDWRMCAANVHLNWPYCEYHAAIVYHNWKTLRKGYRT